MKIWVFLILNTLLLANPGLYDLERAFRREPENILVVRHLLRAYERLNRHQDVVKTSLWLFERESISSEETEAGARAAFLLSDRKNVWKLCSGEPKSSICRELLAQIPQDEVLLYRGEGSPDHLIQALQKSSLKTLNPRVQASVARSLSSSGYLMMASHLGQESPYLPASLKCASRIHGEQNECAGDALRGLWQLPAGKTDVEKAEILLAEGVLRYSLGGVQSLKPYLRRAQALMQNPLAIEFSSQWAALMYSGKPASIDITIRPQN